MLKYIAHVVEANARGGVKDLVISGEEMRSFLNERNKASLRFAPTTHRLPGRGGREQRARKGREGKGQRGGWMWTGKKEQTGRAP